MIISCDYRNISCDLLIFLLLSRFTCGLEYEFYLMFFFSFLTRQRYISWQKQKKTIVLQNKQLTTNVFCWIIPIFGMLQIATDIFRKRLALFHKRWTSTLHLHKWDSKNVLLWCCIYVLLHIQPKVWAVFSYHCARQSKAHLLG